MLPDRFRPRHRCNLIRLGRHQDGGYLVDEASVLRSTSLLSFGIGDDWSFEQDFTAVKDVPVDAYDPTVSRKHFRRRVSRALRLWQFTHVLRSLAKARDYNRFFSNRHRHHERFIGYSGEQSDSLQMAVGDQRNVFLKVDIEGWEYRILDDMVSMADRIEGMVIEFHDVDLHRDRIASFIQRTPMILVHTHPNNAGGQGPPGDPLCVEMTFTTLASVSEGEVDLPHPLDLPNDSSKPDLVLQFET